MAVRGLSMAERQPYIPKDDPAHPDNIRDAVEKQVSASAEVIDRQRAEELAIEKAGEPTTFYLGNLTHEDKIYLSDLVGTLEQTREGSLRMKNNNAQRMYECVRRGVVGWHNLLDENDSPIPFELVPGVNDRGQPRKYISASCLNRMHLDLIREVAAELFKINGVTTELEKKLQEQLQQQYDPPSLDGPVEVVQIDSSKHEDVEYPAA